MEADSTGPDRVVSLYLRPKNNQSRVDAPDKIRCFIGGEWKRRSEFSGRQLEKYIRSGDRPQNSKISCRVHSTQVRRELQCEGPCAKWLPIESFSKSTRSHSKTWCLDCTEWQLSVEPGFAPYVPPSSLDDDDDHLLEDDAAEIALTDDEPGERIEDWIQGNPSELGDYDRVETGTQCSVVGSASDISGPSLLDSQDAEPLGLLQPLNATNLSWMGSLAQPRPSYASVASTVGEPLADQGIRAASETGTETQSNQPSTAPTFSSGTTAKAASQSQSVTSGASTAWMENEFEALAISQGQPSEQNDTRPGWARPNQRRTDLLTPKYVTNSGGVDSQPQSFQKTVYADADDDDSEDEC